MIYVIPQGYQCATCGQLMRVLKARIGYVWVRCSNKACSAGRGKYKVALRHATYREVKT